MSNTEPEAVPALTMDATGASSDSAESGDVVLDMPAHEKPEKLHKSESLYYAGKSMARNATLLEPIPQEREITLTFSKVNSWVPNLGLDPKAKKGKSDEGEATSKRQTLFDVSGGALPGE
eukprot:scaffold296075_cov47-Prasinocladus_malaysianus.AAC.1